MAKFGLNDSDESEVEDVEAMDEDEAETDATYTTQQDYDEDTEEEDEPTEDDDAPPFETLEESEEEGVEYHPPAYDVDEDFRQPSTRNLRSKTPDAPLTSRTGTPEDLGALARRGSRPDRIRFGQAPEPESPQLAQDAERKWRAERGLQPHKVALMQRSLFASAEPAIPPSARPASLREPFRIGERISSKPPFALPATGKEPPKDLRILRPPLRKPRERIRVPLKNACSNGKESSLTDASLAIGRSFRVSWAPGDQLVHRGAVGACAGSGSYASSDLFVSRIPSSSSSSAKEVSSASRLLKIQLQNTHIDLDEDGIPFAIPSPALRFRNFQKAFSRDDISHEALIWRLGAALFDEIDLRLPANCSPEAAKRIANVRREDAFSYWLRKAVAPAVEHDIRHLGSHPGPAATYKRLTGFQLERACDAALASGDLRLSTLIALAGGDAAYKADLLEQLAHWREKRIDGHIDADRRKIYEVLCGNVTISKGYGKPGLHVDASPSLNMADGLDWKRTFGLHFWFQASHVNLRYAVDTYEQAFRKDKVARPPLPWYVEQPPKPEAGLKRWDIVNEGEVLDPLFHLIKLAVEPTHDLETALQPRGFGPSPFDYRMPWHLYTLLARVLRKRDFGDREVSLRDETEGTSARADRVTANYAQQLEVLGMWEWSAFVLLHSELPDSREQALQALLARNIATLDDAKAQILIDDLHIPASWLAAAQAALAKHEGRIFDEFELLKEAGDLDAAHRIVVAELAPEAVLHGDMRLLRELFDGMASDTVGDWPYGGKLFIDYADLFEKLPRYIQASQLGDRDAALAGERLLDRDLPALLRELPSLYTKRGRTITTKQEVAISEMMSGLNRIASTASRIQGHDYAGTVSLNNLQGADRLASVMQSADEVLEQALRNACA